MPNHCPLNLIWIKLYPEFCSNIIFYQLFYLVYFVAFNVGTGHILLVPVTKSVQTKLPKKSNPYKTKQILQKANQIKATKTRQTKWCWTGRAF